MLFWLLLKMFCILALCPVLLASGVQTLTIDSQLGTSIEDCFDRISIGEQLPSSAIYRNVTELTTRECEQICKQDKQCQTYDYGVGAKGNATCDLSNLNEKDIREKGPLQRHPDYDVYVRRIQCEQSPPSPMQPQFDDPGSDRPEPPHRPVFRPDDEKFSDDYLVSTNLRPHETGGQSPYRPDDFSSTKPDFDSPPSYGQHKPQDIPYKPERPSHNQSYNQKPEDELQFQGYGRPERPNDGLDKPQYQYVVRPNRRPYKIPQDDYYKPRPDPHGQNDPGSMELYGQNYFGHRPGPMGPPDRPYRPKRPYRPYERPGYYGQYANGYGQSSQNDNSIYVEIYDPPRPYKPVDRPAYGQSYGYGNTYSSQNSYSGGHSQQYGIGTITDISGYDQNRPVDDHRPDPISNKPQRPGYGSSSDESAGYGLKPQKPGGMYDDPYGGSQGSYGSNKPFYGNNQESYGNGHGSYGSSQGSYGSGQSSYAGNQGSYGSSQGTNGSDQGSYGHSQGSYGSNQGSYGSHQGLYGNNRPSYGSGNGNGSGQGPYGINDEGHGTNQQSYGSNNSSYGGINDPYENSQVTYGNNQGSYGSNQGSYAGNQGGYGSNQGSYGSNPGGSGQGIYGSNQRPYGHRPSYTNHASYSNSQAEYNSQQASYGINQFYGSSNRPYYDSNYDQGYGAKPTQKPFNKPLYSDEGYQSIQDSYSSTQGHYASNQAGYGSSYRPSYDQEDHPGYGTQKPQKPYDKPSSSDQGGNGGNQASYGSNQGSYGGNQASYGSNQGSYGSNQASYGSNQGSYGSNQGSYDSNQASYGSNQASYGNSQGIYNSNQEYDNQKPSYGSNRPQSYQYRPTPSSSSSGYDNQKPENDNQETPGYAQKPDYSNQERPGYGQRPDYNMQKRPGYGKPDYNNEDKPGYGQKPDYSNEDKPGYGQKPDDNNDEKPGYGQQSINETNYSANPDYKPVYEYEMDKPGNVPNYIAKPNGEIVTSRPVVIGDYGERPGYREPGKEASYTACFRRVLAGQRTLRSHVRKAIPCERLEDCRRECATEVRFPCESFNYRLDRTFRGKGLCELMTKPIEAFDLRRDFVEDKDYDFYEVDRNSLEPNCPDTLRGAGHLHSGYLSSKPETGSKRWSDRSDWYDNRYHSDYNRYSQDRKGSGNRRYEDQFFVPYQIGVGRSNDDQENWGQYGGFYGGYDTYYKDRNDYHKSINHWRLKTDTAQSYGVRPLTTSIERSYGPKSQDSFDYHNLVKSTPWSHRYGYGSWKRGRWNNSGDSSNRLEYGESSYANFDHEVDGRSDESDNKDCSSRRRPGMSLGSGAIRRSLLARNVVECETSCFSEKEFKCVSYSYRYSSSHGSDNCFLSERPYRGLEMSADSGSDVYAMPQDQGCVTINYRPWVESECFWHVRTGAAVSGTSVRAALTVAGLGACEAECIRANGFFCRGFSFRFDSPTIGDDVENCILTSSPPTSLETGRGLHSNAGHELYARGNYGRGCEPALYDDTQHRDSECYLQYSGAARLAGAAVRGRARAPHPRACGRACTDAPFRCLSFSYNDKAPPETDNCFLSEIRLFDLQRDVDYVHSADDWLFAFDLFNGQCWRKVHGKGDYEEPSHELPRPITASGPDESYPASGPSGPGYLPEPPDFKDQHRDSPHISDFGPPSGPARKPYPSGPDTLVYKPGYSEPSGPDFKPGYPFESSGPHHKLGGSGFKPVYSIEPSGPEFKPGYPFEHSRPGYKASYLDEPSRPGFKPGYPSEPSGPGFEPGYPIEPSGPHYKPGYPNAHRKEGFKPTYDDIGPGFESQPIEPGLPGFPGPVIPSDPNFKPGFRPVEPERPPRPGGSGPGYIPERPASKPGKPVSQKPVYDLREDNEIAVSWRHYTVSGFPCRGGTACAQNQVAGHWACEPEGGELGSWDYCCAPSHRCGYSEGFHKPWCYVGPTEDQWRPCSEKYYPYHQHSVPHPLQGHKEDQPTPPRPWSDSPAYVPDRGQAGPYLPEADRKYWDDLYENGPKAYYDKQGNPLPGYTRVPTEGRPYIKYRHNNPRPGSGTGQWVQVPALQSELDPPVPGGLGVPRYWPVAYLHKGPPPNMTYLKYNETTNTERNPPKTPTQSRELPVESRMDVDTPKENVDKHRGEKKRNISDFNDDNMFHIDLDKVTTTVKTVTTEISPIEKEENVTVKVNKSEVETIKLEKDKIDKHFDTIEGIDGKLVDFSSSIEVFDIEDAKKGEKTSDLRTLEAEERQIEEIGRLLASRRGGKLVLEKRSQKDLESKNIALDHDLIDFNFGNRFPTTERRGIVQKVTKDEIDRDRNIDRSLEVSETMFVRPPRVLSTTESIRKAIVNGKVFYDASIREQRDIYTNSTRKSKSLKPLEDSRAPTVIPTSNIGKKKVIKARNVNPVRRVRRVYRKRYNPEEVRRRLIERDRSMKENVTETSRKI